MAHSKIVKIVIVLGTFIVLTLVWAINGYDDTWLYITAAIIAIPAAYLLQ